MDKSPATTNEKSPTTTAMDNSHPESAKDSDAGTQVEDLQRNTSLWYKLHVFIYDLRNFKENPDCQARLDQISDASYIGLPYFTADEVLQLKSTIMNTESQQTLEQLIERTLDERLERRMKKRTESGDYRVCAAHDLAPIFEKAFEINHKELAKNRSFLDIMEKSGLKLKGDLDWKGLPKKTFQKKKNKEH